MTQLLIGDYCLERSAPELQDILASAYKNKTRPICTCVSPGIELYIARTPEKHYIVKRMPNSGSSHHPECESYEAPGELSGRGALENKAISEDHDSGLTNLKLDFSLSKVSVDRAVAKGEAKEATVIKADPTKMTIRSLLHYLYEEAGLNRWTPAMEGKRNWFVVRKHLYQAAANKETRKNPLSDFLLIPETFRLDTKDEITARRRQFMSKLKPQNKKSPLGILIGEVKEFGEARFGHKLVVKHMPDCPFYFGDDIHKRLNKWFAAEIATFQQDESVHLMAICTFLLSPSGHPQIDTLSFMLLDRNWIPIESMEEAELVSWLVEHKRQFIKGLRYNLVAGDVIASALITDNANAGPTAVYIVPSDAGDNYLAELSNIIEASDYESYTWNIAEGQILDIP